MAEHIQNDVMIVDESAENLMLLTKILTRFGYTVHPMLNGESVISSIFNSLPDIILLDVRMSGMNGYRVCERLKADERTRDIPVIFLSALDDTADKVLAFEYGGADYVTKPFHQEELLARIKTHITIRKLQKKLKQQNAELQNKNAQLQEALDNVKMLRGLLPICSNCKKIRDDKGYWNILEEYITKHSEAMFSHGLCPECTETLYGEEEWYKTWKIKKNQNVCAENESLPIQAD